MVERKVKNELNVSLVAKRNKLFKVFLGTEFGVDAIEINSIVFVSGVAVENRCEPNCLNAEVITGRNIAVVEVIKGFDNTANVTYAVTVGIGKRSNVNLIKGSVVVVDWVNDGVGVVRTAALRCCG